VATLTPEQKAKHAFALGRDAGLTSDEVVMEHARRKAVVTDGLLDLLQSVGEAT
jgi:hypothetical protein